MLLETTDDENSKDLINVIHLVQAIYLTTLSIEDLTVTTLELPIERDLGYLFTLGARPLC